MEKRKRKKRQRKKQKHDAITTLDIVIPYDVVLHILTRLPVKSLIRFSVVCKSLYESINHDQHFQASHFIRSQKNPRLSFNFYYWDDEKERHFYYLEKLDGDCGGLLQASSSESKYQRLLGYCNGLFCLQLSKSRIEICNPSRRQKESITFPKKVGRYDYIDDFLFGFDSITKEYKVVCVYDLDDDHKMIKCQVLTLGTNSWRKIQIQLPPPITYVGRRKYDSPILCHDALYWLNFQHVHHVISFDLHHEKFQSIKFPIQSGSKDFNLLEFKGSLCVASFDVSGDQVCLHILKDSKEEIWIKETFLVSGTTIPSDPQILCFSDRVCLQSLYWKKKVLHIYNVQTKDLRKKKVLQGFDGIENMDYQIISYIENLHSLQTIMQGGASSVPIVEEKQNTDKAA